MYTVILTRLRLLIEFGVQTVPSCYHACLHEIYRIKLFVQFKSTVYIS